MDHTYIYDRNEALDSHEILILISPLLSLSLAALSTVVEVVLDVDPHQRKSQPQ